MAERNLNAKFWFPVWTWRRPSNPALGKAEAQSEIANAQFEGLADTWIRLTTDLELLVDL